METRTFSLTCLIAGLAYWEGVVMNRVSTIVVSAKCEVEVVIERLMIGLSVRVLRLRRSTETLARTHTRRKMNMDGGT